MMRRDGNFSFSLYWSWNSISNVKAGSQFYVILTFGALNGDRSRTPKQEAMLLSGEVAQTLGFQLMLQLLIV